MEEENAGLSSSLRRMRAASTMRMAIRLSEWDADTVILLYVYPCSQLGASFARRLGGKGKRTAYRLRDSRLSSQHSDPPSTHMCQVGRWLDGEGFNADWVQSFRENEIDGVALSLLRDPVSAPAGSVQ